MNSGSPQPPPVPGPSNAAPPLPPRVAGDGIVSSTGMYGVGGGGGGLYSSSYASPYNRFGYGGSSAYDMYGGIGGGFGGGYGGGMYGGGGYASGWNGMGAPGMSVESQFTRLAEESSRGAFQQVEAVVGAVNSVANMLSSTHQAIYSSFRAVIGVVEQFSRLYGQLSGIATGFILFRLIRRLWQYALVFLRLRSPDTLAAMQAEGAWGDALSGFPAAAGASPSSPSSAWPTVIFWMLAVGAPWLIYTCVRRMVASVEEKRRWATGEVEHYTAQAQFDFAAQSEQELSFHAGDSLRIAPKHEQPRVRGWLLASSFDGQRIGLVPANYVKVTSRVSHSPPPPRDPNAYTPPF